MCVTCSIRAAIDNDDVGEAYAIAADHQLPRSTVRRAIRDAQDRADLLAARAILATIPAQVRS